MAAMTREQRFSQLTATKFDALIIGGGITGAGIAWQLSRYGFKVALVEQNDFASGTSSRSSKLIHGGLRYLPHGEFALVREVSRERSHLSALMPHLVHPLSATIPVYRWSPYSMTTLPLALWYYDRLSRTSISYRHHRLTPDQVIARTPGIEPEALTGGVSYWEYWGHDARIVWSVIETAESLGAITVNYATVKDPLELAKNCQSSPVNTEIVDILTQRSYALSTRLIINAAGPWADQIDSRHHLVRSRGIHLVFPHERLPLSDLTILPTENGANVFAVPHGPITYVGTTDCPDSGDVGQPSLPMSDVNYLLTIVNRIFPQANLKSRDVIAAWSGVRPLIADDANIQTDRLSRRDLITSEGSLITVLGGKFTGFHATAQNVTRTVLQRVTPPATIPVDEAIVCAPAADQIQLWQQQLEESTGLDPTLVEALLSRYGIALKNLAVWANQIPDGFDRLVESVPVLHAEISWGVMKEQVQTVADFVIRRTGMAWLAGLSPNTVTILINRVAETMRPLLDWSSTEMNQQILQCQNACYLPQVITMRKPPE
jgi:glycerol-3-phosphate dehydrogenase